MSSNLYAIDLAKGKFDQSTFRGRLEGFFQLCNMNTLFTPLATITASQKILQAHKERKLDSKTTADELWEAKRIVDATVHPDTQQPIPALFRMSAQVPYNLVMMGGVLAAVGNKKATLFLHFVNQTYNVCLNYANRNASNELDVKQIAMSYGGALASSMGCAVGLPALVNKLKASAATKAFLMRLTPFGAIRAHNILNLYFLRKIEMLIVFRVVDEDGNDRGKSQKAGVTAIGQTVVTRIFANVPGMVIPPVILQAYEKSAFAGRNKWATMPLTMALVGAQYWYAYPVCLAMYPQYYSVPVNQLEPRFQNLRRKDGSPVTTLIYNKGL